MALADLNTTKAPSGVAQGSVTAVLSASQTSTGATDDYLDTAGYVSKLIVTVTNGATNTCAVKLQGSHDATNWADIGYTSAGNGTPARDTTPVIAATTIAADSTLFMAALPGEWPRYVRGNVTSANANGTAILGYLER